MHPSLTSQLSFSLLCTTINDFVDDLQQWNLIVCTVWISSWDTVFGFTNCSTTQAGASGICSTVLCKVWSWLSKRVDDLFVDTLRDVLSGSTPWRVTTTLLPGAHKYAEKERTVAVSSLCTTKVQVVSGVTCLTIRRVKKFKKRVLLGQMPHVHHWFLSQEEVLHSVNPHL